MTRRPQSLEPITARELEAIRGQLVDAADVCASAIGVMKETGEDELLILYKSAVIRAMTNVNRVRESIYQSYRASQMGQPLTDSDISTRSVRRQEVVARSARKKMQEKRQANKKKGGQE